MKKFLLSIAVPSRQDWDANFGMSLIFLTNYLSAHPIPGVEEMGYVLNNKKGSILQGMRQKLVQQALDNDATHLLFIDSDQTFPRDLVHRLVAHRKHVVACNIATKKLPSNPTARQYNPAKWEGDLVYTTEHSTGLEEVWRVGTGIMLIDLNLFKREGMPDGDWFPQVWNPEIRDYNGEDWGFCRVLRDAGVKIHIDHDVSKEVGHMGSMSYGLDLAQPPSVIEVA